MSHTVKNSPSLSPPPPSAPTHTRQGGGVQSHGICIAITPMFACKKRQQSSTTKKKKKKRKEGLEVGDQSSTNRQMTLASHWTGRFVSTPIILFLKNKRKSSDYSRTEASEV